MAKQLNVNLAFRADTGQAKAQIQELQGLLNKIMHSSSTATFKGIDATKIKQAASAAKELQMHLNNAFNADTGKFDLSQLDKSLKASGSNITNLSTQLLNAGDTGQQAFMKLAQSISLADQPMLKISNRLNEFATTMKNTARWQLSSSMLHGFMGAVQSAYGYAQDLNESLTNIRIVTGQNTEQMAKFAEQANKAAKTLSTTTTDYTNASLIYYQQGLTDQEVAERTEVTIKMANAAGQSAEKVSDQLTAVWNNFYDGSQSLEHYADVMTALGAATASSTDEIAGGLEKFAAIADTIGLSYEYAASALATITSNTRQSEEVVGTALKTIFARIQGLNLGETLDDGTTLNKYSEALQKVGLSIFDQNNEIKNMDTILDEMADKWDKLSKDQQMALAQTVAGTRQYTQLVALMDNWNAGDSDSMIANLKTATEATGALDKQAEIYAESWEAASDRVRASAEGLYQSLLDDDFFIDINNGFAEMLSGLDAFIDRAGGLKTIIVGLSSIIISNFANKIPEAIQSARYNIDVLTKGSAQAYQNIQKDMQSAADSMFAKKGVSQESSLGFMVDSSNKLSSARTQLAQISERMSSSEKQLAETELNLMQQTQQETYAILQKQEALQSTIATMKEASLSKQSASFNDSSIEGYFRVEKAYESLSSYNIMSKDFMGGIEDRFQKIDYASNNLAQTLNDKLVNALSQLSTLKPGESLKAIRLDSEGLKESFNVLQEAINKVDLSGFKGEDDIADAKRTVMDLIGIFPKAVTESKSLKTAIESISKAKSADELKEKFNQFKEKLKDCSIGSEELSRALKQFQNPKDVEDYINHLIEINKLSEQAKEKIKAFNQSASSFQPTHFVKTSEAFGSLAGLLGNSVTIINSVSSSFKNLLNTDLSTWERMSSLISAISFSIPMITSAMRDYGAISSWVTSKNLEFLTIENLKNLAANNTLKKLDEVKIKTLATQAAESVRAGNTKEATLALLLKNLAEEKGIKEDEKKIIAETILGQAEQARSTSLSAFIGKQILSNAVLSKYNIVVKIATALTKSYGAALLGIGFVALIAIIGSVIAFIDKLNTSQKEAIEATSEATKSYDEEKQKLQELNDELKTVSDRIDELNSKDTLSLVEQEELDKLLAQEASLERQKILQEQITKAKLKESSDQFVKNFNKISNWESPGEQTRSFNSQGKEFISASSYAAVSNTTSEQLTPEEYKEKYIDGLYNKDGSISEENKLKAAENEKYYEEWLKSEEEARLEWVDKYGEQLTLIQSGFEDFLEANPTASNEEKVKYSNKIQEGLINAYGKNYKEQVYQSSSLQNAVAAEKKKTGIDISKEVSKFEDILSPEALSQEGSLLASKFTEGFKNYLYREGLTPEEYATDLIKKNQESLQKANEALKQAGYSKDGKNMKQNIVLSDLKNSNRWKEEDLEILAKITIKNGDTVDDIFDKIDEHKENEIFVNFNTTTWKSENAKKQSIVNDIKMGDTISDEDFKVLGDAYEDYFELQNDGTYKLIAAAEDLRDAVDAIETKKILDNIKERDQRIKEAQTITVEYGAQEVEETITLNEAQQLADRESKGQLIYDTDIQKIDEYVKSVQEAFDVEVNSIQEAIIVMQQHNAELSASQEALFNSANSLYELQSLRGQVLEETSNVDYTQYAEALMALGSSYENCSKEIENYRNILIASADDTSEAATQQIKAAEDLLNASILIGEASEKYGFDADVLETQAKMIKKLNPEMKLTAEQAAQLAINNQRMNKGIRTLNDNFKNWKKTLNSASKDSMDYAEALVDCTAAIADLVGASDDLELSDEFFDTENIALIEKAMKGDIKAINQLGAAVAEAQVEALGFNEVFANLINELGIWENEPIQITLDHKRFDDDKNIVLSGIRDIYSGAIEAGEAMNGDWVAALNRMALTTGMSVEQMNSILGSLGVQAKVDTTYVEQPMEVPTYTDHYEATNYNPPEYDDKGEMIKPASWSQRKYTVPGKPYTVTGYAAVAQISTEDNPLRVDATTNTIKGGSAPAASYSGKRGSVSPSSTKSSGGGGGSKSKPEKVDKTKKSDVVERYKEINDQIDDMADKLEDATTEADRLYGRNRINKMKEVSNTLQQEIKLLEKKTSEAKEYLKIDRKALQEGAAEVGVNFSFDADGNISNYESQMEALYNKLAAAEKKADPSNFKTKEAQDEFIEKHVTPLKDQIDTLEELISQYDETRELIEDLDNEARDKFNEWQDNNFEILNYELELKLEVDDAELRKLEYLLSKIEDDFYSLAEAGALMIGKENGDELDTTNSQLEIYENRLKDLKVQRDALTNSYKNGEISQSQFVEGLQELEDLAYDNAEAIQELDNTMLHYYGDTLEAAADELSKYTDLMEQHVEVLEHYSNIMDIIGKSTDYEAMGVILEGQAEAAENMVEVSKANYEMLEAQRQARKTEYEAAIGNATDEELAVLKQKWLDAETAANDAQDRMMEDIETWAESLKAVLENKLAGFAQALENVLTGDFGSFDAMTAAMDRANSLQEEYLTTTNKIYETNKLINKAQQEIDKTTNIAAKKRLQAYIQETEQLQNQSELSKYELEIQQAKYDLVLAEIALEEAQNAKSTVRLQRDSEGNFSYVYTADQNKLAEAEQNLADAQNRLYNIGLEGANEYASKYQQTLAEMYDTLADLQEQYLNGAFETEAEYQRAVEEAKEYYYNKLTQYSNLYQVALTTDSAVVADAWSTDFNSMIYKTEEWSSAVDEYLNEVKITFAEWEEQISRIKNETVGQDLDDLKEKVGSITSASDELANSITKDGGVLDGIRDEIEEVNKLTDAYAKARAAIKGTQNAHETFITELRNNIENPDQVVKNKPKEEKQNNPSTNIDNSNNNNNSIDYGKIKAGSKVQVKSGARWHYDSEGTSPTGPAQDGTIKYINLNGSHPYNIDGLGWIKKSDIEKVDKYNTGGYTGSWSGPFGKFAMLHQKELVLNQEDTKNFLTSMEVLERILEMIDLQTLNAQIGGSLLSPTYSNFTKEMLEQSVQIEASFPNVVNRYEIEEAFDTLVNRASQYANRKNF